MKKIIHLKIQKRSLFFNQHIEVIGLQNPDYPQDYLGQLSAPFKNGLDKAPEK